MRVSANTDDPDFIGRDNYGRYRVTIDGFPVQQAWEADDQAGRIVVYERDANGQIVIDYEKSEAKRKTLYGVVQIIDTRAVLA